MDDKQPDGGEATAKVIGNKTMQVFGSRAISFFRGAIERVSERTNEQTSESSVSESD